MSDIRFRPSPSDGFFGRTRLPKSVLHDPVSRTARRHENESSRVVPPTAVASRRQTSLTRDPPTFDGHHGAPGSPRQRSALHTRRCRLVFPRTPPCCCQPSPTDETEVPQRARPGPKVLVPFTRRPPPHRMTRRRLDLDAPHGRIHTVVSSPSHPSMGLAARRRCRSREPEVRMETMRARSRPRSTRSAFATTRFVPEHRRLRLLPPNGLPRTRRRSDEPRRTTFVVRKTRGRA